VTDDFCDRTTLQVRFRDIHAPRSAAAAAAAAAS